MKHFSLTSMRYDGTFSILDQTLLPHKTKWIECTTVTDLIDCIQRLAIRGAPAIGISASVLLALRAEKGDSPDKIHNQANQLISARPTAVNLRNNLHSLIELISSPGYPHSLINRAEQILEEDIILCSTIATLGASLLQPSSRVLTHCNTGSLATAGMGTAMAIINHASKNDDSLFVWVNETRPLLQGARLTAWECVKLGIDHAIICDSAAASIMQEGKVDIILVGSDRIAANGDFANKIGTYSLAVNARYHGIPFYVAAPHTTIDHHCKGGKHIPIEVRDECEIKGTQGGGGSYTWAPPESSAYNPAFDITPATLVSGYILDTGIISSDDVWKKEWWKG